VGARGIEAESPEHFNETGKRAFLPKFPYRKLTYKRKNKKSHPIPAFISPKSPFFYDFLRFFFFFA
jgi:hypothetical protein